MAVTQFAVHPTHRFILCLTILVTMYARYATRANACETCGGHRAQPKNASSNEKSSPSSVNSDPLRFVVVADTQSSTGDGIEPFVSQLMDDIEARNPDFVVFPGDLVGTGTSSTLNEWNNLTSRFGSSRFMVPGNHDLPGRPATNSNWQSIFNWLPDSQAVPNVLTDDPTDSIQGIDKMDYFVDLAPNVRLISVTTDRDRLPGESPTHSGVSEVLGGEPKALDWFKSVMALPSTEQKDHVFVMTHHPVTSQMSQANSSLSLTEGTNTDWWKSISGTLPGLAGASADALFSGHIHAYYPNRPDPHSHTAEIVVGTGGGGSEGVPHRQLHGFLEVTIDNGNVETAFFGDSNEAVGGWSFTENLDTFTIRDRGVVPRGELARYEFQTGMATLDSSNSPLSKSHPLRFNGGVTRVDDTIRGSVVDFSGGAFIDAKNRGDQNFQVLGDLRIDLWVKAEGVLGEENIDNMLVAFGDADGSQTTSGGHDATTIGEEIANYGYQLSYTSDGRLRLGWEYHASSAADSLPTSEFVVSSEAVEDPTEWHRIELLRDAENNSVRFLVDGVPLGVDQPIFNLPTGGGAGSLYLGALPNTNAGNLGAIANFSGRLDDVVISSQSVELPNYLFGDVNGDGIVAGDGTGSLEEDDVTAFSAGWLTDTSQLSNGEKIRNGDVNGDGITNLEDWSILNNLIEIAQNERVRFVAVPEPNGLWAAVFGCLLCRCLIIRGCAEANGQENPSRLGQVTATKK